MNGTRKSSGAAQAQEYKLVLKAREVVETVRLARRAEAEGLVVDILRGLVAESVPTKRERATSGFVSPVTNCPACGQVNRMFQRPCGELRCANCVLDELLAHIRETNIRP